MYDKKRTKDTSSLKDAIEAHLDSYRLKGKYKQVQLIYNWEKIMGKPIATRTTNIYVHKNILFVTVSSAPLKNELNLSKQKIIELFEREMGAGIVDDIIIR
ncbi:MAG: DUF721 domain-containing protein [Cyclobacteriaceae bacterium]